MIKIINNNRFTIKQTNKIKKALPCFRIERNRVIESQVKMNQSSKIDISTELKYDVNLSKETIHFLQPKKNDYIQLRINSIESLFNTITVNTTTVQKDQNKKFTWNILKQTYKNKYFIKGRILNSIKGGMAIGFCGIVAFLPMSHSIPSIIGQINLFQIVSLDIKKTVIVVSQKNLKRRVNQVLRKLASRFIFLNESNTKK
uniref:Ribosomal protein S1 n=1 Tax=Proteomonas sulcata TaxID=77928 RepID=A0A2P1G8E3_9CRYP|nr:ribosomal protein S1 [Proteomonas sulcata]AVM81209.1 ribosomal protein S1 [Proteomonas sulcata]